MKITIWGCRGSLPVPGPTTLRYGGNTTCLSITSATGRLIVVDAGSGIHNLGNALVKAGGPREVRFLFTHAHWDHLLGFPFFTPLYLPDYRLTFCSGHHEEGTIHSFLTHQMKPPFFPVEMDACRADIRFHCDNPCNEDRCCCLGDVDVLPFPVNHPNGAFGYRFSEGGKTMVFVPDNELDFHHEGGASRQSLVELCRGVDLLIHDSQYTADDYRRTRGWGHSTYADTVDLALEAGVRRLGLFHHDPDRCDDDLEGQLAWCRERIRDKGGNLDCFAVVEGMEIDL
jgi:phosphoribosyl 1,2-cyclic phosphodiesterase